MSNILLKVTGISSLTDARYCAGMGVQKLGITFDQNGIGSINLTQFFSIKAWIEGVSWTGTYQGTDIAIFKNLSDQYEISEWTISPDLMQCDFDFSPFKVYLKANSISDLNFTYQSHIAGFEISADGDLFKEGLESIGLIVGKNQELYLDNVANVEFILKNHKLFPNLGYTLVSGEEERPGWMDLSDLQDMLEQLEERNLN